MSDLLLIITIILGVAANALLVVLLRRKTSVDLSPVENAFERAERAVREEIGKNRAEAGDSAQKSREEASRNLVGFGEKLGQQLQLEFQKSELRAKNLREELAKSIKESNDSLVKTIGELGTTQRAQLGNVVEQLGKLSESIQLKLDSVKLAVEQKLKGIQEDNARQLEQMRATVDEKLQGTLEKRLGESFKLVSERLEQVHSGLGEMKSLASGVGDLKKVLSNVKTRGMWGEVQLGKILEDAFTPEQYDVNVDTAGIGERVEFAIKFAGHGEDKSEILYLPIDAKFPIEDYQRLVDAQERTDVQGVEEASKQLEIRIKGCAADINKKYICPPKTTDFAILFLPTEGLFAEVMRRNGLAEYLRRECRVAVAGPTTLFAILTSLQMGFRTLAIQKRSGEVWKLLEGVKAEFGKYGQVLEKVQKKLQEASNTIDTAAVRTRAIERQLGKVQGPTGDEDTPLPLFAPAEIEEESGPAMEITG